MTRQTFLSPIEVSPEKFVKAEVFFSKDSKVTLPKRLYCISMYSVKSHTTGSSQTRESNGFILQSFFIWLSNRRQNSCLRKTSSILISNLTVFIHLLSLSNYSWIFQTLLVKRDRFLSSKIPVYLQIKENLKIGKIYLSIRQVKCDECFLHLFW